ncbi:DNA glycosylase [Laetiporus sulphureus 93-53]|uniref:Endonuclease III homolog n=1 Tax=Laetiporus sulphureus 93-53 TaxID=1314785 RepID=A0A165H2E0_9APHY|nr:DNA glycosylase [Laetiporus sulphureus 93-53]KZT11150.1 DNA glycosylase [Laetiporus sulphureus 93-53]
MATLKRSASPVVSLSTLPQLAGFHSVVLESSQSVESSQGLRRSKRLKVAVAHVKKESDDMKQSVETASQVDIKIEAEVTTIDVKPSSSRKTASSPKKKVPASPRKAKPIAQALDVPHPAPAHWRQTYETIEEMRSKVVAPVDTMGCHMPQLAETVPENQRFATLVSLMLSSQTRDETTFAAVTKLREAVGGSISVDAILKADGNAISEAICKVGFWRRKTQYIRQAAQCLRDDFNSDVPKTVDELCSLPGVGPKMAFLALQDAWKLNAGIGVDVHVHRITNRLGWHKPPTKTPEETRLNLQSWLPLELHPKINALLVGFGQTICSPVGPHCDTCQLSSWLCPSARKVKSKSKKTVAAISSRSRPKIEIAVEEESIAEIVAPSEETKPVALKIEDDA